MNSKTLEELRRIAGSQLDAELVELFLTNLDGIRGNK